MFIMRFFSFPHDCQKHLIVVRLDQLDIWTPDPRTVILRRWLLFWCKLEIHLLLVGLVLLVELLLELLPGLRVVGVCQGGHHHQADCQQQHLHLLLLTQLLTGQVLSGRLFIQSFPSRYLPLLAKLIKVRTLFQMCTNMCGLCLALFCGQNFEVTSIDIYVCQLRPSIPRWVQNFLCVLEASTEQVECRWRWLKIAGGLKLCKYCKMTVMWLLLIPFCWVSFFELCELLVLLCIDTL